MTPDTIEWEPLTYTVPEVAKLLGISRNLAYEAAKRGDLPTLVIGRRILVSRIGLRQMVEEGGRGELRSNVLQAS